MSDGEGAAGRRRSVKSDLGSEMKRKSVGILGEFRERKMLSRVFQRTRSEGRKVGLGRRGGPLSALGRRVKMRMG